MGQLDYDEHATSPIQEDSTNSEQRICIHCGKCTPRCVVLSTPSIDIGTVMEAYDSIRAKPYDEQPAATQEVVSENFELYHSLRQCCFCGFCTATCEQHVLAPSHMRAWRELFMRANLMPPENSKLVMVDNEWHIFSAYRAIYNIAYPDFVTLEAAAAHGPGLADTLLFPGCSLVSYAPELMSAVGAWLSTAGISWAYSDDCCGSPLMSAGLFERGHALRMRTIDRVREAGITKIITVCPGCGEELSVDTPDDIDIVPLAEVMGEIAKQRSANEESTGFATIDSASFTFFDSCHDRADLRHANSARALMEICAPNAVRCEMDHSKHDTLCCGAGGAVSSYDSDICDQRVWRVIDEARSTGAQTLVTMCPTCTYTIAQANLSAPERAMDSHHYLELALGVPIDWNTVFAQLGNMWTGEYAAWLNATFL